jgi:hypothetical protein
MLAGHAPTIATKDETVTAAETEAFKEKCGLLKNNIRWSLDNLFKLIPISKQGLVFSGSGIASLFHGERPKDYDLWPKDSQSLKDLEWALERTDEQTFRHLLTSKHDSAYGEVFKERGGVITTNNAWTLANGLQFVIMGTYADCRASFDYVHCLPYYDFDSDKLHISFAQWRAIRDKSLIPTGYTTPKKFRTDKFRERGWK